MRTAFARRVPALAVAAAVMHLGLPAALEAQFLQQGPKLVGSGAVGAARQGQAVAVSADGNTAIVGGLGDNSFAGAAWVFTRREADRHGSLGDRAAGILGGRLGRRQHGDVWRLRRQQRRRRSLGVDAERRRVDAAGNKLVGTGASGAANQGQWVSLSSTGNRAVVGGWADNSLAGAAWVWTRTGSTWNQTGNKLFGTGAIGNAQQGYFVAMSGDGRTALVGGNGDNGSAGATWVFFGPPPLPFTDSPLQAGVTRIKAVHVNELRQRINALRAQHPLPPYPYSEAVTTSTTIKASHVLEMRQALHEVYVIMLQPPPTYGTTPAPNGPILAAEIESLRTAVLAIGG